MNITYFKIFFACLIFATALLAGLRSFKDAKASEAHESHFNQGAQAFACGVFLGAGLLHMLGESSREFYRLGYDYPFANLITGLIFLSFLWMEHLGREIFHAEGKLGSSFAILATFMLSIHSFFEGAAIGLSLEYPIVFAICLAIFAHKSAASFSLSIQMNKSKLNQTMKRSLFFGFCLMTPLGIFLGHNTVSSQENIQLYIPCLNAAAAGTFMYLGTLHGLDYAVMVKKCCHLREFAFLVLGFIIMSLVAVYT